MVMDTKDGPLTDFDWRVLGMHRFQGVRLNIPMPTTKDGLHTHAHRLAGLSEQFHTLARLPGRNRSTIMDAAGLVRELHQSNKRLAADWEREYQELKEAESTVVDLKEHSHDVAGTR